jgi:hypothetical protein
MAHQIRQCKMAQRVVVNATCSGGAGEAMARKAQHLHVQSEP